MRLRNIVCMVIILVTHFSTISPQSALAQQGGSGLRPVRICTLFDHSASMAHFAIDLPSLDDTRPLQRLIIRRGGSVAYGLIQENPSTSLLRETISAPEEGLTPPDQSTNVFARSKAKRLYEENLPIYEERERSRIDSARVVIDAFEIRLGEFITAGAGKANITDLWGNIRRCSSQLLEPIPYGHPEPDRYLLIISDGVHNLKGSEYEPVDDSITVLSVSGARRIGATTKIGRRVLWFESAVAAINYIVASAEVKN